MSKLITLACALLAIGLGVWSLVSTHQAGATLDEAQALNTGAFRSTRTPSMADGSGGVQADTALRAPVSGAVGSSEAPPSAVYLRPTVRDRQEDRDDVAHESQPLLLNPILPSRTRSTPSQAAQGTMGYTLPQAAPVASPAGQSPP